MNTSSSFSVIENHDDYVENLKATLQKTIEEKELLEQKYQDALKRCNELEHNSMALHVSSKTGTFPANMEEIVSSLKQVSFCINESLAHGWSASNHILFKIANKLTKHIEHTDQTRIHSIMEPLDRGNVYLNEILNKYYQSVMPTPFITKNLSLNTLTESTQEHLRTILQSDYQNFDVLVFGTIDYDYLYQRPQHFADYFASQGHRVFYINASFHHGYDFKIQKKTDNLFLVNLPCFSADSIYAVDLSQSGLEVSISLNNLLFQHCIKDAVLIADHPNWVHPLLQLKEAHGFKIVTDYMDDYSGFENEEQDLVVNSCKLLLQSSDLVVASSIYLQQQALKLNRNVALIRNGTDFAHFNTAYKESSSTPKKTIGYYGVISSWFDYDKIKYLSNRFPQHNIVLIGDVLESKKKFFKNLRNVQLTGVKPYSILPEHLKDFDVCLIPFDSSLSLIKATNPVKFYEYLSAAKKIVATEMPELKPFKDKFVYLTNDNKTFGDYVELCLNGKDILASPEECIEFARENDWSERSKFFVECIKAQFPKVNIVIETVNPQTANSYEAVIRATTAYPNYRVHTIQNADSSAMLDCDYVVFIKENTVLTRGWLTSLVHEMSVHSADAICPVTYKNETDKKLEDLRANMYIQAEKHNYLDTTEKFSDNCVILSLKAAHSIGINRKTTIKQINQSNLNIVVVNSTLTNNN